VESRLIAILIYHMKQTENWNEKNELKYTDVRDIFKRKYHDIFYIFKKSTFIIIIYLLF